MGTTSADDTLPHFSIMPFIWPIPTTPTTRQGTGLSRTIAHHKYFLQYAMKFESKVNST